MVFQVLEKDYYFLVSQGKVVNTASNLGDIEPEAVGNVFQLKAGSELHGEVTTGVLLEQGELVALVPQKGWIQYL